SVADDPTRSSTDQRSNRTSSCDLDALKFDIRRSDDPAPFLVLSSEKLSELCGCSCKNVFTPNGNGLFDFGIGETGIDRLVERIDDWRWRILGGDNAHPAERFIAGYKLGNGRHIRQRWYAYCAGDRKRAQSARFDVLRR